MKIATWNVNGIRARQSQLQEWVAREQPDVNSVGRILSMYMGPNDVIAVVDLTFKDGTSIEKAAAAIAAIEARVRARYPMIKRLFIEAGDRLVPVPQL